MTESNQVYDVSRAAPGRMLFVLVIVGAAAAYYFHLQGKSKENLPDEVRQMQERNEKLRQELAEARDRMAELDAADLVNAEEHTLLQANLLQLASDGAVAKQRVGEFAKQVAKWKKLTEQAGEPETGRRIASEESALTRYGGLMHEDRARPERAAELAALLETLLGPVNEALKAKNSVYAPSDNLKSRIAEIGSEAEEAANTYRTHNARLQAIIASAPAQGAEEALPLNAAVSALEERWAEEQNRRIEEAAKKVREEATKRLAQQKADQEAQIAAAKEEAQRQEAARELQRVKDKEEEARVAEESRRAALQARLAQEKLEADFKRELPQIRKYLAAFMYEGYSQPGDNGYHHNTTKKGPMSLSALQVRRGHDGIGTRPPAAGVLGHGQRKRPAGRGLSEIYRRDTPHPTSSLFEQGPGIPHQIRRLDGRGKDARPINLDFPRRVVADQ